MHATEEKIKAFRPHWTTNKSRNGLTLCVYGTEYADRAGREFLKSNFRARWNKYGKHWEIDLRDDQYYRDLAAADFDEMVYNAGYGGY